MKEMAQIITENVVSEVEKYLFIIKETIESEETILNMCISSVSHILSTVENLQRDGKIGKLSGISFMLRRVFIMNENYKYSVLLYNEDFSIYHPFFEFEVYPFYQFLKPITQNAFLNCKKYVIYHISIPEIEQEVARYLKYFNMFVVETLRKVFQSKDILEQLKKIGQTEHFVVFQNDISQLPYCIYECSIWEG